MPSGPGEKASATLLGIPAELRLEIIDQLFQPYDRDTHIHCCDAHLGPSYLMPKESDADSDDSDAEDLDTEDSGILAEERETIERCRDVASLMQTCRELSVECRDRLWATHTMDFCILPALYQGICYAGSGGLNLESLNTTPGTGPSSIGLLTASLRSACIIIDMIKERVECAQDVMQFYDNMDHSYLLMQHLAASPALRQLDVHVRDSHGLTLAGRTQPKATWEDFYVTQVKFHLQALQMLPDHISVKLHFGVVGSGPDVHMKVISYSFPPGTEAAKYVQSIVTGPRSQIFSSALTLLSEYLHYKKGLQNLLPFICSYSRTAWEHDLVQIPLAKQFAKVWRAHYCGNVQDFEKANDAVKDIWKLWLRNLDENFMAI